MPGTRFNVSNKKGSHLFNQAELDFGRKLRDEGMQRSADHAEKSEPGWSDIALDFLAKYLKGKDGQFMAEEVRMESVGIVSAPPHARAWGSVMIRAAKAKLIRKVGLGTVKNSKAHKCFATIWTRI